VITLDYKYAALLRKREKYEKTSHILHLLLTLLTGGLWVIMWAMVAASNASQVRAIDKQLEELEVAIDSGEKP